MIIHEALENYLESILILREKQAEVRSVDICNYFGFAKSTVSVAMKKLREGKMIKIDSSGYISLTTKGEEIAKKIYERHVVLTDFFIDLGVSQDKAAEDACKIEHDLSDETFDALKQHFQEQMEKNRSI